MKIAVWHNLPSGGGKRALYYHVKGLVERGHIVESWCPSTANQSYLPLSGLVQEHIKPLNLPYVIPPFKQILNAYRGISDFIQAIDLHCQQCAEEINQGEFDILFANACSSLGVSSIAKYVKIPKVIYLGEPYRRLYEASPQLPWLSLPAQEKNWLNLGYCKSFFKNLIKVQKLRIQAREEVTNARAFDRILVNSLYSRESIQRAYGLDAQVCYLGIDTNLFTPLSAPKEKFVIGLGSVNYAKGIERAIQAIATIAKDDRPPLLWVGNFTDPEYQRNIEEYACSLAVDLTIKVGISDKDLILLLNQALAMIYTSRLEPFGLAPLEANACGTSVVALAEGGVRESIQDGINGFLINNNDLELMGKKISLLLNDSTLMNEMSSLGRKHVLEKWSLNLAVDNLERSLFECQSYLLQN